MKLRLALLVAVCTLHGSPVLASTPPMPNWQQAQEETVRNLTSLVRIDTSNPPGNETRVAEYMKAILDKEGIPAEIIEMAPGRGNLVARLKGSGKQKPILLMSHIDVVGVERDRWSVDPFAAVTKDGYLYGRGVYDDKGMTSANLQVLVMLHRLKVPLDRDVILLAEADEEAGGEAGIKFMIEKHWDKIACEFALNEGGWIYEQDGNVQYVGVSTTEKVPRRIRLVAKGTSGHGSMPRPDNAVTHLAAAVAKLGSMQMPMRLNETTQTFFRRLATISPATEAALYRDLENPGRTTAAQEQMRLTNIMYNSMLRTSLAPTIIKGGFRNNVIPAEAEATIDIRALPDEDIPKMVATLRKVIDDPTVEVLPPSTEPAPAPSRLGTEMFKALERVQAQVFPGAVTLPVMLTGATDSAPLRAKGVQAYGVGSVVTDEERLRIHGNDERLSIAGLGKFVELLYRSVVEIAATK
ncbi:MAG: M20/M25/M40 family metallo-hydrolase [Gemmatimonadaceae bacterium]|nr:M20/M25/M40 family metallo-hydrolase [Gloeobacterales cyanobacterium ES-bin-141]